MDNPDVFLDVVSISAVVGALIPLLISLIKRAHWSNFQKKMAALGVSLVAAVATVVVTEGSFDIELLLASAGTIFALAKTTYDGIWEDTSVDATLTRVMS